MNITDVNPNSFINCVNYAIRLKEEISKIKVILESDNNENNKKDLEKRMNDLSLEMNSIKEAVAVFNNSMHNIIEKINIPYEKRPLEYTLYKNGVKLNIFDHFEHLKDALMYMSSYGYDTHDNGIELNDAHLRQLKITGILTMRGRSENTSWGKVIKTDYTTDYYDIVARRVYPYECMYALELTNDRNRNIYKRMSMRHRG